MAGPNDERGPSAEDRNRMAEIRSQQQRPSGDPRMSGPRGSKDSPFYVRWAGVEGGTKGFFDSFRAPKPHEGPQREGEGDARDPNRTGARSFQATMRDHRAVAESARQIISEMRSAASQISQFSVEASRFNHEMRMANEDERQRVSAILDRLERSLNDGGPNTGPKRPRTRQVPDLDDPDMPLVDVPEPQDRPRSDGEGNQSRKRRQPRPEPEKPAQPAAATSLRFHEMAAARENHYGGVRRRLQRATAEAYHQELGQGISSSPTVLKVQKDDGSVVYQMHGPNGQVGDDIPEEEASSGLIRKARNAALVSRVAGGFARGGLSGAGRALGSGAMGGIASSAAGSGAMAGMAGFALKAVPYIGTAVAVAEATNETLKFAQEQRAKNVYYQGIYGGENVEGFGHRLREEGFVWGQRLTTGLQEQDARQLFKGVSSMGLQGSRRDEALDIGQRLYKDIGLSVQQSLQAMSIAAKGANTNMVGLERAFKDITKTARNTGQSATQLNDRFISMYQVTSRTLSGASGVNLAKVLTQGSSGLSRTLSGMDASGIMDEDRQRLLASYSNMTYGELVAQQAMGNNQPMLQAQDRLTRQAVDSLMTPDLQKVLDREVQSAGGWDKVKGDPNIARNIGIKLMEDGQLDPGLARDILENQGVDMSGVAVQDVPEQIVNILSGKGSYAEKDEQTKAENRIQNIEEGDSRSLGDMATFESPNDTKFVRDHSNGLMDGLLGVLGGGVSDSMDEVTSAYDERQESGGKVEPAIEAMIDAIGDDENVGIEVQTKDGKKVVSKADAVRYYADQINRGTATLVGGGDDVDGRTVGELTGVTSDNVPTGDDTTDDPANADAEGVSAEDWKKEHPTDDSGDDATGGSGGKIKIEATDELRRFLKISGSGSVDDSQVNDAAGAGVPPNSNGGMPE